MDWRELEALIREERRAGNPVAGAIHSLQLDQNKITLLLSNLLDGEEVWRVMQQHHGYSSLHSGISVSAYAVTAGLCTGGE
jgi:hypothetical protein